MTDPGRKFTVALLTIIGAFAVVCFSVEPGVREWAMNLLMIVAPTYLGVQGVADTMKALKGGTKK